MATKTSDKVQFNATHSYARISPRKVNLVLAMIRGKNVNEALKVLRFSPKRAAYLTGKVLKSCIANAENVSTQPGRDMDVDVDSLVVARAVADSGPMIKRWHPVGMGRAFPIHKRTCHIKLTLEPGATDEKPKAKKKSKAEAAPKGEKKAAVKKPGKKKAKAASK